MLRGFRRQFSGWRRQGSEAASLNVILRSPAFARRLEGWPHASVAASFEARRRRRAPQDDGGGCGGLPPVAVLFLADVIRSRMALNTPDSERLTAMEQRKEELRRYLQLFETAFDELHSAVIKQAKIPGQYIGVHHDYPLLSCLDSGFPSFHEAGFYRDTTPKNYVGTVRPSGLAGLLGGYQGPTLNFPKGAELASFLRSNEIGERLDLGRFVYKDKVSDRPVDDLVGDASGAIHSSLWTRRSRRSKAS